MRRRGGRCNAILAVMSLSSSGNVVRSAFVAMKMGAASRPSSSALLASPPPPGEVTSHRFLVTVGTTVAVSSPSSSTTTTTTSASSSSSASFVVVARASRCTRDDDDDDDDAVPMNTPARMSLPSHLSLRPISGKGLGVVSTAHIPAGQFVGEYAGEVMAEDVKDRRYLKSMENLRNDEDLRWVASRDERGQTTTGCYLYGISLPPSNNISSYSRVYVDAEDEYFSLWTRFLNHASRPYDNVSPRSIHESYDGRPRVWFVANRDIEPGDEICFDYGDDYWLDGDDVV